MTGDVIKAKVKLKNTWTSLRYCMRTGWKIAQYEQEKPVVLPCMYISPTHSSKIRPLLLRSRVHRHQAVDLPLLLSGTKLEPASSDNCMNSPKNFYACFKFLDMVICYNAHTCSTWGGGVV